MKTMHLKWFCTCLVEHICQLYDYKTCPGVQISAHIYTYSIETVSVFIPFLSYSASNNGMTLKSGLGVIQGRRLIDHIRLTIGLPL